VLRMHYGDLNDVDKVTAVYHYYFGGIFLPFLTLVSLYR
jgi:hypothetical protein